MRSRIPAVALMAGAPLASGMPGLTLAAVLLFGHEVSGPRAQPGGRAPLVR